MSRFEEMAKQARASHDQSEADKKAIRSREEEARTAQFNNSAESLLLNVMPIFEEAQRAFTSSGAPCIVEDNWRKGHGRPMRPELTFQCVGQLTRNSMGGHYQAKSVKLFVSRDNEFYRIGIADHNISNQIGQNSVSVAEFDADLVSGFLESVLKSYFEDQARNQN